MLISSLKCHIPKDKIEGKVRNCYLSCNFKENCLGKNHRNWFYQMNNYKLDMCCVTRIAICNM